MVGHRQTSSNHRSHGFTIVELLIVIIVIAILAAIVIVAYNGITKKAQASAAQSAARDLAQLLNISYTNNSTYPSDLSTVNNGGPMPTSNTTYAYHPGSGNASYCATITNGSTSYEITDTATTPVAGGCPGDSINGVAAITNLLLNPSLENNSTANNWGYYSSPLSIDNTMAAQGTMSLKTVTNSSTNPQGIVFAGQGVPAGTYTCSMYIAGTAGTVVSVAGRTENPYAEGMGGKGITMTSGFQRVSVTFTLGASVGTLEIQAHLNSAASGITIWGDGAMCTSGSTVYNYADGSSSNWTWNGTPNSSTSSGVPL